MGVVDSKRSPAWRRYLRFWGQDAAGDLDDELRFHIDARYDEFIAQGLDPAAARAEVEKRFGDVTRFRDECADIDSRWSREQSMSDAIRVLAADFRFAWRQLARTPSLTIAAVLCFALGIGANTSIFSVVDAVLFRALPFDDADRLVLVGEGLPKFGQDNFGVISAANFSDYRQLDGQVFASSAIYVDQLIAISGTGTPESVRGVRVAASLFDVLHVRPTLGRAFMAADDRVDAPGVTILGDALWRRRFGADPRILGQTIDLDGKPSTIVGIMPPAFHFPLPGVGGDAAELFVPYPITALEERDRGNEYSTYFVARLAPNISLADARRRVSDVAARLTQRYPQSYRHGLRVVADVFSLRDRAVRDVRKPLLLLLVAVGAVLLIACINVASLLLARLAARRREIAVRRALGASRFRLAQQFFVESLLLVGAGGTLGVAFALWGARALATHAPEALPQRDAAVVDLRILAVTAGIVVLTAFVFSILPVVGRSASALGAMLRDDDRAATGGKGKQRARRALVVAQVALALTLVAAAGLMARSFARALDTNAGFETAHAVSFRVGVPKERYPNDRLLPFEQQLIERLATMPGVRSVSATSALPMTTPWQIAFAVEGVSTSIIPGGVAELVMPDYFDAMRIPLREGRPIDRSDVRGALTVAVVNETLARQYFGTSPAVGHRIKHGSPESEGPWMTIIGVAADVKIRGIDRPVGPAIYIPAAQVPLTMLDVFGRSLAYVVRTDGDPLALSKSIRQVVRASDPSLPVIGLRRLADVVDVSVSDRRFNTVLLGAFAFIALMLASIGIYGLISYAVVQSTRELGIRLAIGATPTDVLGLIVGRGARIAVVGIAIGLVGALGLSYVMRSLLFDVSPLDPLSIGGAALLLLIVAVLASYIPARRAARIDPQSAIRAE